MKTQYTFKESYHGILVSLVQSLQPSYSQNVARISISVDDTGCEAIFKLVESISKYEAEAKTRLDRLEGIDLVYFESQAADTKAGGDCGASAVRLPK